MKVQLFSLAGMFLFAVVIFEKIDNTMAEIDEWTKRRLCAEQHGIDLMQPGQNKKEGYSCFVFCFEKRKGLINDEGEPNEDNLATLYRLKKTDKKFTDAIHKCIVENREDNLCKKGAVMVGCLGSALR